MGSSVAMEKEGLRRCLDKLLTQGVLVASTATDRHTGVASLMKKEYSFIEHQYDVWHMAKSVTKKLTKKAKAKYCGQLYPWIQSISNHLWWAAQTCDGDALRNGNQFYITFPMYMNGTMNLKHCSLNACIQHCPLRRSGARNG